MKAIKGKSSLLSIPFISKVFYLGLGGLLVANAVRANEYFDVNGATSGFGIVTGTTYSWDDTNWGTSSTGVSATANWPAGNFARFPGGVSGNSYTVVVSNSESMAGLYDSVVGTTITISATNGGNLSIVTGQQGFFVDGSATTVTITAPITGPGGIQPNLITGTTTGSLNLYGTNTFAGGITFLRNGGVNVNNSSSFGTGPIAWGAAQQVMADLTATSPLIFSNSVTTRAASQWIVVTPTIAPITFAGPWTNATGLSRLTLNPNSKLIIGGPIFGASGDMLKDGVGTLVINGTNANTGVTTTTTNGILEIGASGSVAGTVTVSNIAGYLQLDGTNALTRAANLKLSSALSNNSVNLNFTGTDTVFAVYIDGVAQPSGSYGPIGSGADNQNAFFTGTGFLNVPATPLVLQQPQPKAVFVGGTANFSVTASGGQPLFYQWKLNNTNASGPDVSGANNSTVTISPAALTDAGVYSVTVSNSVGATNSTGAALTVLPTNFYTQTVVGDSPVSYWRLDETNGTVAEDVIGTNNGTYVNVNLNQAGFSQTDTDPAIGLPLNTASRGYVQVPSVPGVNFQGLGATFSLEAWAYFTNLTGVQRMFSTLAPTSPGGYGFGINGANGLRYTTGGVQDADVTLASSNSLVTGVWYHMVLTCDGSSYNFFINGNPVGSVPISGLGQASSLPVQFGANPPTYATAEQVNGRLDEIAIYNSDISGQVMNHYQARYGTLSRPVVSAPIASPATNYVSLVSTIQAVAGGQALSYQWFKSPSTLLSGETNATLTLSPLALTNSGNYFVQVSNPIGSSNSPVVGLTVLPIPTNATDLNLTNALVLHLPFDSDLKDVSGRGNNGTNVGSTSLVSPGAIGTNALHYSSDTGSSSFNYVTLGVRPDLQFGATTNFTVSFWIRQPQFSAFTNLPFFTDAIGSTGNGGYAFAPYAGTGGGGWMWTAGTVTSPNAATHFPDANLINDGNWHNLVHVADRSANLTTYLDGAQVDSQSIVIIGNINTANAATIGQDPTGTYPVTASADIDDLGVWQRTLTPLEVSGIYLAGASNSVSFAPAINPVVPVALTIQQVAGQIQISWPGGAGTLQASTNVVGTYTNVVGGSPYTVPTPMSSQSYYRLKF